MKKGEVTTTQLVTIIVLIASFVIILLLIFRLDLGQTTNQEICRNSVVLQGQPVPSGPLDCKTNYVEISGETKSAVMQSIANEMEDCWWMFGEGKIDYGSDTTGNVHYAICSEITFEEKSQEKIKEITYTEFYEYLENTTRKDSGRSYLNYLYGVDSTSSLIVEEQFKIDLLQDKILTSQTYSLITGVDNGIGPLNEKILRVYLIPKNEISTRLEEDREFITRA